jgi:hypothetical protein
MPGLLDIAPVHETIEIRGQPVTVSGITLKGVASLLSRFPDLGALFGGQQLASDKLAELGSDIIAALIAAGCGAPEDPDVEAVAVSLSLGEQVELLNAVIRVTMPRGVGPFVEQIKSLGNLVSSQA